MEDYMDLKEMLGNELYEQVKSKIGDKELIINDGNYIPKSKFNEKNEEVKLLRGKITDFETQNTKTKELLKGHDELKEAYGKLQKDYKTGLEAKDKELKNLFNKTLMTDFLKSKGATYPELLIKNIDMDKVNVYENKIMNGDEIIKPLQEQFKDLFKTETITGGTTPPQTPKPPSEGKDNPFMRFK
jgi:hypothetical protein